MSRQSFINGGRTAAILACNAGGILVAVPPGVGIGPPGLGRLSIAVIYDEFRERFGGRLRMAGRLG